MNLNKIETIDMGDLFRACMARKWIVISTTLLVVALAAVYSLNMRPVYQASAKILIENSTPKAFSLENGRDPDGANENFYQTQYRLLQSRSLAKSVIQHMNLENSPELVEEVSEDGSGDKFWLDSLKEFLVEVGVVKEHKKPEFSQDPYSELIDRFLEKARVNPIAESRLVDLSFQGYSPNEITKITNTIADLYILRNIELRSSTQEGAGEFFEDRINEVKRKLERSEAKLQRFLDQKNLAGFTDRQDITSQKMQEINTEYNRVRSQRIKLETTKEQLAALRDSPIEGIKSIPDSLQSKVVSDLNREYVKLETALEEQSKKFGPRHPNIINLVNKKKILEARIPNEVNRLIKSIEIDYRSLVGREESLEQALGFAKKDVMALNKNSLKFEAIKREVESNKNLYETLLNRINETDVSSKNVQSNIRIVDRAEVPLEPIKPRIARNLQIGAVGGMFLGVGMVMFLFFLDNKVRTLDDLDQLVKAPVLGTVGLFEKKDGTLPILENVNSPRAEEYRIIRSNLLYVDPDNPKKILMVSSASPSEGKTTTMANMAVALAHINKRVLVMECDLRKPKVHSMFGVSMQIGLVDLLFENAKLKDCVKKTRVPNLYIIPRGGQTIPTTDIFNSNKFASLLTALKKQFDYILVDVPPILFLSEASVLFRQCDGVLFVIRSGMHSQAILKRAMSQFEIGEQAGLHSGGNGHQAPEVPGKSKVLGVVLNALDMKKSGYYGYYGKYYKDYYFSGKEQKPGKKINI